jgi:hypothetical protein
VLNLTVHIVNVGLYTELKKTYQTIKTVYYNRTTINIITMKQEVSNQMFNNSEMTHILYNNSSDILTKEGYFSRGCNSSVRIGAALL